MTELDYTIKTQRERAEAVASAAAAATNVSVGTAETLANYILWGTDDDGTAATSIAAAAGYELPAKNKHWQKRHNTTSLDAMLVDATPMGTALAVPKIKFDREEARRKAPPHILASLEAIWKQCDELELITTYYDIIHRGRTKPIRPELAIRFSDATHYQTEAQAKGLTQQQYLAMKHLIVELRTEQYSLRDSYAAPMTNSPGATPGAPFGDTAHHLVTLPLDLGFMSLPISRVIKNDWTDWVGSNCGAANYIGQSDATKMALDFREPEHLAQIVDQYLDLAALAQQEPATLEECETMLPQLIQMFNMYVRLADLSPMHLYILKAKIKHTPNAEIAEAVASAWGHKYGVNYISTIYHKKILQTIAETVELHFATITNIHDASKFKTCRTCGATLLKDPAHFMRKKRVSDGFAPHCKKCSKKKRDANA